MNVKLTNAYNQFTSPTDSTPGVVDEGQAQTLVTIAKEIDRKSISCCSSQGKGTRDLQTLYDSHKDAFQPAAAKVVEEHLDRNPGDFEQGMKQWAWAEAVRNYGSRRP